MVTSSNTPVSRYRHDAPERDLVNFPPPRMQVNASKVRMGFIPNSWFEFMYDKTGVTGLYFLLLISVSSLYDLYV